MRKISSTTSKNSRPNQIEKAPSSKAATLCLEVASLNQSRKPTWSLWKKYQFHMVRTTNAKAPSRVNVAICAPAMELL